VRSVAIGYILWALGGVLGIHRFYCGRIGTGILWFFTGGLLGIGWLVDVFLIPDLVREANLREPPLFIAADPSCCPPEAFGPVRHPAGPAYAGIGVAPTNRVIYCTQCGSAMQVPASGGGMQYACPRCRTVLEVPA